ncbi:hypothetical protein Ait01nite_082060 [Actinoplanes italicus]|uniref:Phage baseplate assembly protein n=1 Tax=Actinoplanes italicus TaxID=113567 RepID=A0A2T0K369_9ACTN|nr:hypothetical protein [Actinoplanes italicus]PRX17281.1 hypothetical protein CLV67_11657 [Actinoplanes italicus]GIE35161.1 hypothetical protein Ait01nite_082060 [Actinoplanes italicus]
MPLPVPNLDDRTFDDLLAEVRALIPGALPGWTDHNPSDPGITLLELFAFLAEAAVYQVDRIPERSLRRFAALAGGSGPDDEPVERLLARTVEALRTPGRAVTGPDIARVLAGSGILAVDPVLPRALRAGDPLLGTTLLRDADAGDDAILVADAGHGGRFPVDGTDVNAVPIARSTALAHTAAGERMVRVLVLPGGPVLCRLAFTLLKARTPITTRVRVAPPRLRALTVEATVVRDFAGLLRRDTVQRRAEQALSRFLHPLTGGDDGTGWEFGRPVFRSELFQVLERLDGVDHVRRLLVEGSEADVIDLEDPFVDPTETLVTTARVDVTVVDG